MFRVMLFKVLFPPFCFGVYVQLLFDPTIPLLDNQTSQANQNHASTGICLGVFTIVLFIMAKQWQQLKNSSSNKQINKIWSMLFHCKKQFGG